MSRNRPTNEQQQVGDRIQMARLRWGLTQGELAEKVRLSRSGMSVMEQGGSTFPLLKMMEIAQALGVSLEWLATGKQPKVQISMGDRAMLIRAKQAVETVLEWSASDIGD